MLLAYVNLLWFLFTILGFVIFGITPATIALFTIVRKWQMKETEIPIWRTFLTVYKQEFKKSNKLGLCLILIGAFLILDFLFLRTIEGTLHAALFAPLLIISSLYIITMLFIIPVYVHYDLKIMDYLKNACFLGILNIHMTLLMLGAVGAIVFLSFYQPGLIIFFSMVSVAWTLMFGGLYSFKRIEERQRELNTN